MKTSKRFDRAIEKLYKAFHNNTLNPDCCMQCAVGNICDNTGTWRYLTPAHGSTELTHLGELNESFGRRIAGYKPSELLQIEAVFLRAMGYGLPITYRSKKPKNPESKELLFQGLSATVGFLCTLEGISDVMDCTVLFDFEPSKADSILMK